MHVSGGIVEDKTARFGLRFMDKAASKNALNLAIQDNISIAK